MVRKAKAKGRRYRVIRRRYSLTTELWLWVNRTATERKGDPAVFGKGELIKILKPGSVIVYYHREAR